MPDTATTQVDQSGAPDRETDERTVPSTTPEPSLDEIFDVLRNSRRRHILERLATLDDTTSHSELAEYIGGIENDRPPETLTSQERKRVYVGLYQSHLPKMADVGAITHDDRGTVEQGPHFDRFREYMDDPDDNDDRFPPARYTVGVVAASLLGAAVVLVASETVSAVIIAVLIGTVGMAGIRFSS
jgi:hypothetical protein